jgi:hypothetical protein
MPKKEARGPRDITLYCFDILDNGDVIHHYTYRSAVN